MIIRIGNLSDTYAVLKSMEQHIEAEESSKLEFSNSESSNQDTEKKVATLKKLRSGVSISYSQAELFDPLDFADFFVRRIGNIYTASIIIKTRQLPAFRDLSSKLVNAFKEQKKQKLEFLPTIENGAGYIIGEAEETPGEKGPIYSITEDRLFRLISIGARGATRRLFPDGEKTFKGEIEGLEGVANIFINTVYKNYNDPESIVKVPENLIIEII